MGEEELEALCRSAGKSYAVSRAILCDALQDCEKLVEAAKKDSPRQLARFLKSQNEQLRKLIGK